MKHGVCLDPKNPRILPVLDIANICPFFLTLGLLNHDWTGTRSQVTVDNSLLKMIDALES